MRYYRNDNKIWLKVVQLLICENSISCLKGRTWPYRVWLETSYEIVLSTEKRVRTLHSFSMRHQLSKCSEMRWRGVKAYTMLLFLLPQGARFFCGLLTLSSFFSLPNLPGNAFFFSAQSRDFEGLKTNERIFNECWKLMKSLKCWIASHYKLLICEKVLKKCPIIPGSTVRNRGTQQ